MKGALFLLVAFMTVSHPIYPLDKDREVFIIGISGGSGSGKTYMANKLKDKLGDDVVTLCLDDYYLDLTKDLIPGQKPNFDHPSAFDFEMLKQHLRQLKQEQSIEVPDYDFVTSSRLSSTTTKLPAKIVIIEGILLLFDEEVRDMINYKIFINTEDDIRFDRRLARDTEERGRSIDSVYNQYFSTVYPMYVQFVKPTAVHADIIVNPLAFDESIYLQIIKEINSSREIAQIAL